jgi:pilus assembly protein CpaE
MAETIKILLVVGAGDARQPQAFRPALEREPGFEVVAVPLGPAGLVPGRTGADAVLEVLPLVRPELVLVDCGLADVDGLTLTESVASKCPWTSVVALVPAERLGDPEFLRRAGLAGARQLLPTPVEPAELIRTLRQVYHLDAARRASHAPSAAAGPSRSAQVFAFYAAKGGLGCTTLACNTAVALKQLTGKEVALFDCGLLFGDVAVLLNLDPRQQTIVDLLPHLAAQSGHRGSPGAGVNGKATEASLLDADHLNKLLVTHVSGIKVLLAPSSPEQSEVVQPQHVRTVLGLLRDHFDYVVVDTWPTFDERMLHVLDAADQIVVPTTLELPAVKNTKLLLDVVGALGHPADKVKLVLNRVGSRVSARVQDVEASLGLTAVAQVASDWRLTTLALNQGVPLVLSQPDSPIAGNVRALAQALAGAGAGASAPQAARGRGAAGLLRVVFGT